MLQADSILVVRGRVSRRDDGMNLHAQSAFTPDLGAMDDSGSLVLVMPERRASEALIGELLQTLTRHAGDTEVVAQAPQRHGGEGLRGAAHGADHR